MEHKEMTAKLAEPVAHRPGCAEAVKVEWGYPPRYPYRVRAICLAFWLGAPGDVSERGGPIALLGYFVLLGGYCLLRDSWRIVRGDL